MLVLSLPLFERQVLPFTRNCITRVIVAVLWGMLVRYRIVDGLVYAVPKTETSMIQ